MVIVDTTVWIDYLGGVQGMPDGVAGGGRSNGRGWGSRI